MISEEKLKKAAEEYEEALLASLPEDIPNHRFSEDFERKMDKSTKTAKRETVCKPLRRFAYAAVLLLFCSLLIIGIRNNVLAANGFWAKRTFDDYVRYHYVGTPKKDAPENYDLTWSPAGYMSVAKLKDGDSYIYIWEKDDQAFFFLQLFYRQTGRTGIDTADRICSEETVDGQLYAFYLSENPEAKSDILWIDENDVLFHITAIGSRDTLLAMAKSVTPAK